MGGLYGGFNKDLQEASKGVKSPNKVKAVVLAQINREESIKN